MACVMLIRYFQLKKKKPELELILMFLTLNIYASKHKRSFTYVPNRNIMSYAINNMTKKSKLKQFGNLYELLKDTALTCHNTYEKTIEGGLDEDIIYYIEALVTRIGHFIKKNSK